jgi:hypothetical protein
MALNGLNIKISDTSERHTFSFDLSGNLANDFTFYYELAKLENPEITEDILIVSILENHIKKDTYFNKKKRERAKEMKKGKYS